MSRSQPRHNCVNPNGSEPLDKWWTASDQQIFDVFTTLRGLAKKEHFSGVVLLVSRISAVMKFGAGAVEVKVLIVDLMDRLEVGFSVGATRKSCCDEEMAKASEKKCDLEAGDAKDQPKFEPAVANGNTMDGRKREPSRHRS